MPDKAMNVLPDSQNPSAPLSCSSDERPPVIFTPAGIAEMRDSAPTLAIRNDITQETYDCPFCNSPCTRDYCWYCHSELLEDDQDE